jgi:hypothetical protein
MWWADTANDILKQRNGADSAWISILTLSTGAPLGTLSSSLLSGALPAIDGSALTGVGKVLQVVSTTKTTSYSMSSSTWTDVPGLSVSISPAATSSKVLISIHINLCTSSAGNNTLFRILRDTTAIGVATDATSNNATGMHWDGNVGYAMTSSGSSHLDSPSTTASTTYKIQIKGNTSATSYVNTTSEGSANQTASTFTLMEIGA